MEDVEVSARSHGPRCRFCDARLSTVFVDLGMSPLSNDYLTEDALSRSEMFYPLCAYVCDACFLVQVEAFAAPERIFGDYAYFSSYSESWLDHARAFAAGACDRFKLGPQSLVIEAASNDGYLLQHFQRAGVPVLGIEPARNVAKAAGCGFRPAMPHWRRRGTPRRRNASSATRCGIGSTGWSRTVDLRRPCARRSGVCCDSSSMCVSGANGWWATGPRLRAIRCSITAASVRICSRIRST